MIQVILADNQAIFRAGAARVLALEDNVSIVAQCEDAARLENALDAHIGAILLVSASLQAAAGGLPPAPGRQAAASYWLPRMAPRSRTRLPAALMAWCSAAFPAPN